MATGDPVLDAIDDDIDAAAAELRRLREFRAWWVSRNARIKRSGDAQQAMRERSGEPGEPFDEPAQPAPRRTLRDFVLSVLSEGAAHGPAEIARRATDLGWSSSSRNKPTMVRNTLVALEEDGMVERHGRGWRLPHHVATRLRALQPQD